jgi:hypothetical protein
MWLLFTVYGVYSGRCEGAEKALVADLVEPERRGTAFGMYHLALRLHSAARVAVDWLAVERRRVATSP